MSKHPYGHLRDSLRDHEGMDRLFVRLSLQHDSMTAAIVTMAALDVPLDRVAEMMDREPVEVNVLVDLFNVALLRSIRREREARGQERSNDAA